MPLLRDEAEKLSNNELEQGVIETIIDRDDLFAVLPFMKIDSKAYLYNREATLSEATFIDVNDTITEGAATFTEHVAKLRILAGDVDVDKFLATTMSDTNNQLAIQVRQKVKGLARAFRRNLILGDSTTNSKAFDGIPKLMHKDQNVDIAKAAMTFSMFDELVDAVKDLGADCIMMRSEHLRAYRALLRTVNIGPSEIMMEDFGRPMLCHNGVPFIVNDFIPKNDGDDSANIYCLHLSEENGVTGLYGGENAGIVVENIGTVQNKDATRTRVKWYCSLANKHDKAIAALTNVKI
ncbi:phage major capsid protein [Cronobacter sakazakii]|uniref:major capsid protein n=1 Tax=Cronobacter sakazakii TaxID=28141 RepID=UPI0009BC009B|nr:phage capsid protein [Cronobacter sakazakii]ELY2473593.1 phage major capsid protein [Cronobacter sakazakii]ELY2780627.1 phage major capsid protein [Cronobacter sakazakii]ELY3448629.1 phage major capsid protein [Cronobacter sakazakii]ELY4229559.1 phage major capsid protein [Cronobacter sakazakii]ELY4748925.1 phage major capsid protein [Cronobacter sakazakii]